MVALVSAAASPRLLALSVSDVARVLRTPPETEPGREHLIDKWAAATL